MEEVTKETAGTRKRSRRSKGKWKAPGLTKRMKELWQEPEFREKMKARDEKRSALMKAYPERFFRRGVPDGMRKRDAEPLWAEARILADKAVRNMIEQEIVDLPKVPVPDSDEEKAKACLTEACVLALGPTELRAKVAAIKTVLEFTKQKPATNQKVTLENAGEWLAAVAADAADASGAQ